MCEIYRNSAPAIRKKQLIIKEKLQLSTTEERKKVSGENWWAHIFHRLFFARAKCERMSRANCTEKCYKFTVHFQIPFGSVSEWVLCVCAAQIHERIAVQFLPHPRTVSALNFYSHMHTHMPLALKNFTFSDQTCCLICSRACSGNTACASGVRIFFEMSLLFFRVCVCVLSLLLLLLLLT